MMRLRFTKFSTLLLFGFIGLIALTAPAVAQQAPIAAPDVNVLFSGETIIAAMILVAVTMAIHGCGMLLTIRTCTRFRKWTRKFSVLLVGLGPLILASWMIFASHILEVAVWALFVWWIRAIPDLSNAFYFAILQYTTVGSSFTLPFHWRGLEGALAMTGLLTFAWSTGVLMSLVEQFQRHQFELLRRRGGS